MISTTRGVAVGFRPAAARTPRGGQHRPLSAMMRALELDRCFPRDSGSRSTVPSGSAHRRNKTTTRLKKTAEFTSRSKLFIHRHDEQRLFLDQFRMLAIASEIERKSRQLSQLVLKVVADGNRIEHGRRTATCGFIAHVSAPRRRQNGFCSFKGIPSFL